MGLGSCSSRVRSCRRSFCKMPKCKSDIMQDLVSVV
jgi:hypothetical protein